MEDAFRTGDFEDVEFAPGTEASDSFRDGQLEVAGRGVPFEGKGFFRCIPFPLEGYRRAPGLAVGAVCHGAGKEGAVAGVFARQVNQFIQLVHGAEVQGQVKGQGVFPPYGVPYCFLVKVEEFFDVASRLGGARELCAYALRQMCLGSGVR